MPRYRFQIQLDVYAENDNDAFKQIKENISALNNTYNEHIFWGAECPFASYNQRELDTEHLDNVHRLKNDMCDVDGSQNDFDFF
tara:strand:- start:2204 stop:2455 length:252 start_codon:yes stop_codon:yes gene_type:complete